MRLFIGINIPKKQRTRMFRVVRDLREGELPVRWIEPEHYHVTLKFLGEVRRERVSDIEQALEKVGSSTKGFTTSIGGFGAFPTIRRPQVIWVGVGANPELRCMKQDVEWALGDVGFGAESRSFHPHVTLGRVEDSAGAGVFRGLDQLMAELDFEAEIKVRSVDLIRSQQFKEGPRYTVLASSRLSA